MLERAAEDAASAAAEGETSAEGAGGAADGGGSGDGEEIKIVHIYGGLKFDVIKGFNVR
jgi:hypothetical protein